MLKTKETQLLDDLQTENERRLRAEFKCDLLARKLKEMNAF